MLSSVIYDMTVRPALYHCSRNFELATTYKDRSIGQSSVRYFGLPTGYAFQLYD